MRARRRQAILARVDLLTVPGIGTSVSPPMRLLRLLIWLATLLFAVMLFMPLVREIIHRLTESAPTALP